VFSVCCISRGRHNEPVTTFGSLGFNLVLLVVAGFRRRCGRGRKPKVQILSPKDGSRITKNQKSIFVNGKVARDAGTVGKTSTFFLVIDISGSTAMYGGADLGDADQPPESSGFGMPQNQHRPV